jgi:hypothetical protein
VLFVYVSGVLGPGMPQFFKESLSFFFQFQYVSPALKGMFLLERVWKKSCWENEKAEYHCIFAVSGADKISGSYPLKSRIPKCGRSN